MTLRPFFLAAATIAFAPLITLAETPGTTNAVPATAPTTAPAAPAPAAEATAPTTERPSSYTIESGDSLWTIAHKFGTTVVALRNANHLKKGALLHPGQQLVIPPAKESGKDAAK